jgi:hypothetical protein
VEHGYELTDLQATMAWGASCMQVVAPGFCALSSYSSIPLLKTNSKIGIRILSADYLCLLASVITPS